MYTSDSNETVISNFWGSQNVQLPKYSLQSHSKFDSILKMTGLRNITNTTTQISNNNRKVYKKFTHTAKGVKSKVFPIHIMKAHKEREGIAPLILNFSIRCKWPATRTGRFTEGKVRCPGTQPNWLVPRCGLSVLATRKLP